MTTTYEDLVAGVLDYLGAAGAGGDQTLRLARRACADGLRDLVAARDWAYYRTFGTLDVTAGEDTYPLPEDWEAIDEPLAPESWWGLCYVDPGTWQREAALLAPSSGTPRQFTITGHPTLAGRLAVRFYPTPDADTTLALRYRRRPRPLLVYRDADGVASADAGSADVLGAGTAFAARHVGCVLRLSPLAIRPPGTPGDDPPPAHEATVVSVPSATHLVLDVACPARLDRVKYTLSDPVDVEPGAMLTALRRGCELQAALNRPQQDRLSPRASYAEALRLAGQADARLLSVRTAGVGYGGPVPLRYRGPIAWTDPDALP